ncbi:MAG: hypothetical protein AAF560_05835 [Acidobacteriota bacterium]
MRILLIDDEPTVTEDLNFYLAVDAHTTENLNFVGSRDELIALLEDFKPEGVTLDFDMKPSGETLYGWIRSWSQKVVIIFYTKYAKSPLHQSQMRDVGALPEHIVAKGEAAIDAPKLLKALRRG